MRGRPQVYQSYSTKQGNTPAYAGKTHTPNRFGCLKRKHPRICGEDLSENTGCSQSSETPPHMRGRPLAGVEIVREQRNTPAYAGKTVADVKS